jgi:hypothetical protein
MKRRVGRVVKAYFHTMSQHYLSEFMQARRIREDPVL